MTESTPAHADDRRANRILFVNTVAFGVCFAAWMMNGPLSAFLIESGTFAWNRSQIGLLIGVPVLTGAVMRLPVGILCDKYGGRIVYFLLMLVCAIPMLAVSWATRYEHFIIAGLGFGLAGASFAAGVAYTSVWFPRERVGTALGIFGMGNAGAAATSMLAPLLLQRFAELGPEGWRWLPRMYAALLVVTALLFWLTTHDRRAAPSELGLRERLAPLRRLRVWRFGLYYAFFFGGFVALSQWLIPYYVNVYTLSVVTAGWLAAIFSLPSSVIRAIGGWLSDRYGARRVMYGSLGAGVLFCVLLFPAAMVIHTPGEGVIAAEDARVVSVSPGEIVMSSGTRYSLRSRDANALLDFAVDRHLILPESTRWQDPVVEEGEEVRRGDLLAQGTTRIFFQANRWVFTAFAFLLGCSMGIGMAAVYTHIPTYFPTEVGVVGGLVGVFGGLGGFVLPIVFGALLEWTGLWTTCWLVLAAMSASLLVWMHLVIRRMMGAGAPDLMRQLETQ